MKKNLLILTTLFIATIGYSQNFTVQDSFNNALRFTVTSSNTVSVTPGSTINNINVDIPSSVSNGGTTYSVTAIGPFSFDGDPISNVSIPNTVTSIEQQAFSNTNLTSVVLPSNLETIGDYAFQSNQLSGLTFPNNLTSIGNGAFRSNPLVTVTTLATLPPSITTINGPNDTFHNSGDRSGIDLIIPAGTTDAYVTNTGALWTGFSTVTENLNVGDTYIDNYITYEVISVASSTVKAVNYNTAGGTTVNIPATIPNGLITYSVIEIGNNAFQNKGITAVSLPNTLLSIGVNAFFINNLSSVTIPDSVVTIDNIAFAQNNNMTNLVLGNNVTSIGDAAFRFTALTTVTIPASVTNIGAATFGISPTLTDVYCEGTIPATIATTGAPNTDTFENFRSNINLHIPVGTMGAYVTDPGAQWTGFNSVTEDASLSASNFEITNNIKVVNSASALKIISDSSVQLKSYSIYSISGVKVKDGNENLIATNTLASGMYILELTFDKSRVTKKFVK